MYSIGRRRYLPWYRVLDESNHVNFYLIYVIRLFSSNTPIYIKKIYRVQQNCFENYSGSSTPNTGHFLHRNHGIHIWNTEFVSLR